MSRVQLLFPLILWALWRTYRSEPIVDRWLGLSAYATGLLAIVGVQWLVGRLAVREIDGGRFGAVGRFHRVLFATRWSILCLHAAALYAGGIGDLVLRAVPEWLPADSPSAVLSVLPVLVAWTGLLWTQYAVDRAVRERSVLAILDAGLPVHAPPSLGQYLTHGIRTQMLFTLLPVLLAVVLRDAFVAANQMIGWHPGQNVELAIALVPVGIVFFVAPELLRRILPTQRLPASPLREKLEAVCRRLGLRYRDILLWRTNHNVANAAVMGLVPQVRYVMLTDLLIETLDDRQIEAVFAHEAGHVVYRHITWFVVYAVLYFVWLAAAEGYIGAALTRVYGGYPQWAQVVFAAMGVVSFFGLLGLLSRQFERQADLFAARTLSAGPTPAAPDAAPDAVGVSLFNAALLRVAALNNMPLDAQQLYRGRNWLGIAYARIVHYAATWLHGSIRARTEYLQHVLHQPHRTRRFDRRMVALRLTLLLGAVTTTAWLAVLIVREIR